MAHLNDYKAAVADREGFKFYEKVAPNGEKYTVGNYASIMVDFPSINNPTNSEQERKDALLLRDMRGIIFNEAGDIVRLPLRKFFNLNENYDTRAENLDDVVGIYDKLDGSMVAPFKLGKDMYWGTKAGVTHMTPDIEAFVAKNPQYKMFAAVCIAHDYTPTFEFMSRKHRIVIDYGDQDQMVLLAIRDMITGDYLSYDESVKTVNETFNYGGPIPVVKRWDIQTLEDLAEVIYEMKGIEGVVAEFANGQFAKLKCDDYRFLHKTRDQITQERHVAGMVLRDVVDDIVGAVPDYLQQPVLDYAKAFVRQYEAKLDLYTREIRDAYVNAVTSVPISQVDLGIMFDSPENAQIERQIKKEFAVNTEISYTARTLGFRIFQDIGDLDNLRDQVDLVFKDMLLKISDRSDTEFQKEVRTKIFEDQLPDWSIWAQEETDEEG